MIARTIWRGLLIAVETEVGDTATMVAIAGKAEETREEAQKKGRKWMSPSMNHWQMTLPIK
jgi:hypothetical protein